jgi:glycosyltransferase involved in cell wall biosynthesis
MNKKQGASSVNMIYISLVVPCFNEEISIPVFYEEAVKICTSINEIFEIIFVDDGSVDNTLNILRQLTERDIRIHYISFSRNFGKEAAMLAGLQAAQGEYVSMLDADLQHPPSLIPQMLEMIVSEQYDCIAAKRTRKGDPPLHSFFARSFYRIFSKFVNAQISDGIGDFRLMTNAYVNAILQLKERNRFSKGIYPWIGFKTGCIEYENVKRASGITKWSFLKLFFYSLDGIIAFSTKLLSFVSIMGLISFFLAIALFILFILRKIIFGVSVDGFTSIICLIVFFSGIILLSIGITGQYIAKIYTEVKRRPHYIIREAK